MKEKIRCQRYMDYMPGNYLKRGTGGYYCTRTATYTNGQEYVCRQHAKEPATVLRKASGKIMDGYYPIEE